MRVQGTEHNIRVGTKVYLREDSTWVNWESYDEGSTNPIDVEGVVYEVGDDSFSLPVNVSWSNGTGNSYHFKDLDVVVPDGEFNRYYGREIPKHEFI